MEVPPQKSRCCWREAGPSSCDLCSREVSYSPLSLSTSSVKRGHHCPGESPARCCVALGKEGGSLLSSSFSAPRLSLSRSGGVPGSPSVCLDLCKFSVSLSVCCGFQSPVSLPPTPPPSRCWVWGRLTAFLGSTAPFPVLSVYFLKHRWLEISWFVRCNVQRHFFLLGYE